MPQGKHRSLPPLSVADGVHRRHVALGHQRAVFANGCLKTNLEDARRLQENELSSKHCLSIHLAKGSPHACRRSSIRREFARSFSSFALFDEVRKTKLLYESTSPAVVSLVHRRESAVQRYCLEDLRSSRHCYTFLGTSSY